MADPRSKRSHVRLDGPFPVEYRVRGTRETVHAGEATELSAGGMFLRLAAGAHGVGKIHEVGTILEIRLGRRDRGFVAEVEVVRTVPEGMGARFLTTLELVSRLVLTAPSEADAATEDTHLEERLGVFRVTYGGAQQFRQDYSRHLRVGGLQIPVRQPPPPAIGSDVQLRVTVEGSGIEPVLLRGRVVAQLPGGIGVEISNLQSTRHQLEAMAGLAESSSVPTA